MILRQADMNDASALLSYLIEFLAEKCNTVPAIKLIPNLEQERQWLKERIGENGVVIISEEDNKIIGLIETSFPQFEEFKHNCEFGMSVLFQYRNKGIGRKLLEEFICWAREQKIMRIELNVFSINLPAIKLYKDLGFKEDGRRIKAVKLSNNGYCDLVHMFKFI